MQSCELSRVALHEAESIATSARSPSTWTELDDRKREGCT
jgi:hypothetical protein